MTGRSCLGPGHRLGRSAEDYLEAVHVAARTGEPVRVTDIARQLGVSKPSVVSALAGLEAQGLVRHERYGVVELTEAGRDAAETVYDRHRLLLEFLRDVLGVPGEVAARDACEIEHVLSPETVERLVELVKGYRKHGAGVCLGQVLGPPAAREPGRAR